MPLVKHNMPENVSQCRKLACWVSYTKSSKAAARLEAIRLLLEDSAGLLGILLGPHV